MGLLSGALYILATVLKSSVLVSLIVSILKDTLRGLFIQFGTDSSYLPLWMLRDLRAYFWTDLDQCIERQAGR